MAWLTRAKTIGRRLARAGDTARDAGHARAAALLYEEALRLLPHRHDLRVQIAHMHKEAGDLVLAEQHYLAALKALPRDADLAAQLGHFYALAGQPAEAASWHARAAELGPPGAAPRGTASPAPSPDTLLPIPELLPSFAEAPSPPTDALRILRLGARVRRTRTGNVRTLSGVEAIRGMCHSAAAALELTIRIGDTLVHQERLAPVLPPAAPSAPAKFVFNAWVDTSGIAIGDHSVTIELGGGPNGPIRHQERRSVVRPLFEVDFPDADAIVAIDSDDPRPPEAQIRARASMIRAAPRRLIDGPVRAVLVQRADQLGDLVVSVPAIRRVRTLFPDAKLVGLLSPANAALGERLGLFDDIVVVDFRERSGDGRRVLDAPDQASLSARLASYGFDVAIDLATDPVFRPLLLLSGARVLHGFGSQMFPWLTVHALGGSSDPGNMEEASPHAAKLVALVDWLGAFTRSSETRLPLPAAGARRPYALLHSGARLPFSRWPHFAELACSLLASTGLDVVVLAADEALVAALPAADLASGRIRAITSEIAFAEFDALVAGCAVFVGNDSGPKHLAALRGAEVVSLHSARLNWSEWGQATGFVISRRVPCAGCAIVALEDCAKAFTCIRDIGADEVMATVTSILRRGAAAGGGIERPDDGRSVAGGADNVG